MILGSLEKKKTAVAVACVFSLVCVFLFGVYDDELFYTITSWNEALGYLSFSPKIINCRNLSVTEALWDEDYGDPEVLNSLEILERISTCSPDPIQLLSYKEKRHSSEFNNDGILFNVPNIVHRVKYSAAAPFNFVTYMSYKSVDKFQKPDMVFLHGDTIPSGKWWNRTLKEVPNIYFVYHPLPETIGGNKWKYIHHCADVTRLQIISDYGGMYFDDDVIALKSFNDLRAFNLTLGRETNYAVANGAIIGNPSNAFVKMWLDGYKQFKSYSWNYNSLLMANRLVKQHPSLVHIENTSMFYPNYHMFNEMYTQRRYDWSKNYCVHFYKRSKGKLPKDEKELKGYDCTAGDILRFVYYGNITLLSNNRYHA